MSSTAEIIFQIAEAVSAISLPVGGGLAAYAKWRRTAEKERQVRENGARVAAEQAAKAARSEEQSMRDALLKEKNDRIASLVAEVTELRKDNDGLHTSIVKILTSGKTGGLNSDE